MDNQHYYNHSNMQPNFNVQYNEYAFMEYSRRFNIHPSCVLDHCLKLCNGASLTQEILDENIMKYTQVETTQNNISDAIDTVFNNTWWTDASSVGLFMPVIQKPILINASTGYGKTFFAINTLAKKAEEARWYPNIKNYVLLIVNRVTLRNQIIERKYEEMLGHTLEIIDKSAGIYRAGKVIISNYQQFSGSFNNVLNKIVCWSGGRIAYIVMDEAHYFVSDAKMGSDTSDVLVNLLLLSYMNLLQKTEVIIYPEKFIPCQRIYLTATPKYVKEIIAFEEEKVKQIICHLIESLNFY